MITSEMNEDKTIIWWRILCGVAVLNILLFVLTACSVSVASPYVRWHLILSGIYTAVCAYRSFWPRIGVERYCLVDAMRSSMVFGRTAATVAEVSFAIQIALILDEMGGLAGLSWVQSMAVPVVLLLALAQLFCWWSVLTLNHAGHAIEESIWGLTFACVGFGLGFCAPELNGTWQTVALVSTAFCAGYVLFMVSIDVPMYVRRWRNGRANGEPRLGFSAGWSDALNRRVVTRDWEIWKREAPWLTGYFSCAVWVSLAMVHLPHVR